MITARKSRTHIIVDTTGGPRDLARNVRRRLRKAAQLEMGLGHTLKPDVQAQLDALRVAIRKKEDTP